MSGKKLLKNRLPKTKIILLQKQIMTFKLTLKLKIFYRRALQRATIHGWNTLYNSMSYYSINEVNNFLSIISTHSLYFLNKILVLPNQAKAVI
jgi:hypothetical protein